MSKLKTTYLGLELSHPVVASASPLSGSLDGVRRLEDGGASAIVLPSLFEEQILADESSPSRPSGPHMIRPGAYLELVRRAREAVSVPVIASLNGRTAGAWTSYGRSLQEAGAAAIEVNLFQVPTDVATTAAEVERRHVEVVEAARRWITIPLAVKIGPFFSAPAEMAARLVVAGADGLVLFNRFYQPDIDLKTLAWSRDAQLSTRAEIRVPLLWIALLHGRLPASIAATTGVQTAAEVVKYVLAGADVVMTTAALLRQGPSHVHVLVAGLEEFLERSRFHTVSEMRGVLSRRRMAGPNDGGRADYVSMLADYRGDWRGSASVARASGSYETRGREPAPPAGPAADVSARHPPP
jgi:dihydroorotate dehydrogenase (fumarate)